MGRDPSGAALVARDRTTLDVEEALGEACCQGEGADEEDTWRLGGAHVLMLDVMKVDVLMLVMKVMKGLVTVKVLLEVKVLVVVKEFVAEALLFSLSSTPTQTTHPRTRPAALGLGLGR